MTFLSRIRDQVLGQPNGSEQPSVLSALTLLNHVFVEGGATTGAKRLIEDALTEQTTKGQGWIFIDTNPDDGLRNRLALAADKAGRADEFYVLDLQNTEESAELDLFRGTHAVDRADRVLTMLPTAHDGSYQPLLHLLARLFELADSNEKTLGARELSSILSVLHEPKTRERLLELIPVKDTHFREHVLPPFEVAGSEATQAAQALATELAGLANSKSSAVINAEYPDLEIQDVLAFNKMCLIRAPANPDSPTQLALHIVWKLICTALNARRHTPSRGRGDFLLAFENFPAFDCQYHGDKLTLPFDMAPRFGVGLMLTGEEGCVAKLREIHGEAVTGLMSAFGAKFYFPQEQLDPRREAYLSSAQIQALDGLRKLQPDQYLLCVGDAVVTGQVRQLDPNHHQGAYQRFEHERFQFRPSFSKLGVHDSF